ncbi:Holliday junction branch migration protein RuvA [candidate division Kazan bacterium]|uniref:Holliday junction branch migration complex subunit RuvA n=1 Tax=candidate division Kazan bacterium TaxID=2202143 RepID=A0A420ZD78_UNCK3|nr:MAG: Holliday junction branch migration protein RuvA [candidate division Kazan bacterium]
MIGYLTGKVQTQGLNWIILETSGGVGYKVFVTSEIIAGFKTGSKISLLTHLVVREDQLTLYGFLTEAELNFFAQLISVSGVGPKSALGVLNAGKVSELRSAINKSNVAIFTTISGIGKKTAERIIVELKNRLEAADGAVPIGTQDLLTALAGLGYNAYEVKKILPDIPKDLDAIEDRLRYALKLLGK